MKKVVFVLLFSLVFLCGCENKLFKEKIYMKSLDNMTLEEVTKYAKANALSLNVDYTYNEVEKDKVVSQSIKEGTEINPDDKLDVVISKGVNDTYKLSLAMVGDVLIHSAVYADTRKYGSDYNFKPMVESMKSVTSKFDLAYYNQETILGGVELGLTTYPRFNSPQTVGDMMLDLGFNVVSLANNHTLDRNEIAVTKSIEYWSRHPEALTAGSYTSFDARNNMDAHIKEKNNIKYGFLSYTTNTNGLYAPAGKEYLVNVYNPDQVKKDVEAIKGKVDVLMVAMHWGVEYTHVPTQQQVDIANYLASLGVDIVIGAHPHVIQPIKFIDDTLVIYSLGNFFSGQVGESKSVGLLAAVDIVKTVNNEGSKISLQNVSTELVYTKSNSFLKDDVWYSSNYHLYPFSKLNNSILNNYASIRDKYNNIVTQYDKNIRVNMFG